MKVSVKMLVQLDSGYRHGYGKCPQYAFQSKHKSKNGSYRRNNYKVLYHRIASKNGLVKVENKTVIEQTMSSSLITAVSTREMTGAQNIISHRKYI